VLAVRQRHAPHAALLPAAKLARWLGPWAGDRAPGDVVRTTDLMDRNLRAHLYRPSRGRPRGAYLVAPGLHYLGPDDPRSDRFCRILATAGFLVLAPFLPDYLDLRMAPRAADDLAIAFAHLDERARAAYLPCPAIFSISFGSHPAVVVAASDAHRDRVGALVLFGGFADFDASVRFAITGRATHEGRVVEVPFDPTNAPVVFLNMLPHVRVEGDRDALARAWHAMVERTWGRPEMKAAGARDAIADEIARGLGAREKELFLVGCGLREGGAAWLDAHLDEAKGAFAFADPRPHLARVRAPVAILHGRGDDVIPWIEAEKLRAALPPGHPHEVLVTGLYGHTGVSLAGARAVADEVRTMTRAVRAMAAAPLGLL
jgi:pimeloyl-ACP methyl ester carboxylesterase